VPIVGLTYPDVLLGLWVYPTYPPSTTNKGLAEASVGAFEGAINPDLKAAYTSVTDGKFVDITADTGAYKFSATKLAKYQGNKVPKAVAEVCKYTWYCALGNIHANTKGYALIGKEIVKALPKAKK